jgi:hypothetical protein
MFVLSLVREYGFFSFRECRLSVTPTIASLSCTYLPGANRPPLNVESPLTPEAVTRLRQLATAAHLYGGRSVGFDGRSSDGVFETLRVTNTQRETSVLVTTGNRSFAEGARKELLDELRAIEQWLHNRARPPQGK